MNFVKWAGSPLSIEGTLPNTYSRVVRSFCVDGRVVESAQRRGSLLYEVSRVES